MRFFGSALVLSTLFLSVLASPAQQSEESQDSPANFEEFQRLLEDVDDRSIHSVLHSWSTKFQDGVFSKDRSALEHLHSENPPLATHLLHMAKRQTNETSTSALPSASTIIVAPSTPTSATAISTKSGAVIFSTSGGGLTTISSAAEFVSYTRSSSTVLSTFTLPDGSKSTLTSVIVTDVPITSAAPPPTGTAGAATSTGTGNPGLQTGAANPTRDNLQGFVMMLGGAAAVAMAL